MLDQKTASQLHRRSLLKYLLLISFNWAIIIGMIVLAIKVNHWALYIITPFIVASRQHGLFVIMHDQVHGNIARKGSKRWIGDLIANVFCSYPLGMNTNRYREQHLTHHKYPNGQQDPYWHSMNTLKGWKQPQTRKQYTLTLLKDLLGMTPGDTMKLIWPWHVFSNHFSRKLKNGIPPLSLPDRLGLYIFMAAVGVFIFYYRPWAALVLWFLAQNFILNAIIRVRAMAEHPFVEVSKNDDIAQIAYSNTVTPNIFERFFFAPFNASYHTVHHLYPGLPTYNLKRAHKKLLKIDEFKNNVETYDGYLMGKKTIFGMITNRKPYELKKQAA